jgi:two-component system, sensor histidine kinase and response regulator
MTLPFCQLRILIAENDVPSRKLAARTLEKMGTAVVLASSGKEALARFAVDHFDLIFMGLDMPVMDGFAVTAAIRCQENPFDDDDHVPIVAMTTLACSSERERCLAAGMDCYIEKPASAHQIQIALLAFANPDSILFGTPPPKWNRMKALERVGGDTLLLAELLEIFMKDKAALLGQMDRAVLEHKSTSLQKIAHALQDQLHYLGAGEESETARKLAVTANQTDFLKAGEMAALLRFQLSAPDAARNN